MTEPTNDVYARTMAMLGPALERVASDYLRRWRFNSLAAGGDKVWGEITIRFRPR